jgi:hypothetical protein
MSRNLKCESMLDAYPCTVADLRKSLFLKLMPAMRYVLDVNGNNVLVPLLMAAGVRDLHDLGPPDVVSSPSGFSLNLLISS